MVASDSFAEFVREQLVPLGRVTMRRMFGKTGVFCDGPDRAQTPSRSLFMLSDRVFEVLFQPRRRCFRPEPSGSRRRHAAASPSGSQSRSAGFIERKGAMYSLSLSVRPG